MIAFSGWTKRLQYSRIREEPRAVREAVGLFDLSHMGELRFPDQALAQRTVSRDLSKLRPGRIQYALLCNEQGGIIDDILVYAVKDGGYIFVVNAGNQDSDYEWIQSRGAGALNVGREWGRIGVQGPPGVELAHGWPPEDSPG